MPDFSLVQRAGETQHHIARVHAFGPYRVGPGALCAAYAAEGWANETRLTLAGVHMLRDVGTLCEGCDAAYATELLNAMAVET
jgi:hypothetical protein